MPNPPTDVTALIEPLIAASTSDRVNWRETAKRGEFSVFLESHTVTIYQQSDNLGGASWYTFAVSDGKGVTLESIRAMQNDPNFGKLAQLHRLALRRARNVDANVARIIEFLRTDGPIGASGTDGQ